MERQPVPISPRFRFVNDRSLTRRDVLNSALGLLATASASALVVEALKNATEANQALDPTGKYITYLGDKTFEVTNEPQTVAIELIPANPQIGFLIYRKLDGVTGMQEYHLQGTADMTPNSKTTHPRHYGQRIAGPTYEEINPAGFNLGRSTITDANGRKSIAGEWFVVTNPAGKPADLDGNRLKPEEERYYISAMNVTIIDNNPQEKNSRQ